MGKKVPFGTAKFLYLASFEKDELVKASFGFAVTTAIDAELTYERIDGGATSGSIDIAYNVLDPLVGFGPGVSFGIRDVLDNTEDGIAPYMALTYHVGNTGDANQETPSVATLGFMIRDSDPEFFVGYSQPFTNKVLFVIEHDSESATVGFEFRPTPGANLRWLHRSSGQLFQIGFSARF